MNSVVMVAAGKGTRMGGETDKLFLSAAGEPVVAHSWRRFDEAPGIDEVVLVIRDERRSAFQEIADRIQPQKPFLFVEGGAERQDSVWNGLQATRADAKLVAIHDAARPCVTQQIIHDCLEAADRIGASVAANRVADTLKSSTDEELIAGNVDRSRLWSVQTPQVFRRPVILQAMQTVQEQKLVVTDDTAACEAIGQPVSLVESPSPNPKVTVPADIPFVEWLLASQAQ